MQKVITWVCVFALLLIHTADMELTEHYIGNNAQNEAFPPMSWCIAEFGIQKSLWVSRIMVYFYLWFTLLNQHKKSWFYFLILVTILYWTAMIDWSFQLELIEWPFPKELLSRYG